MISFIYKTYKQVTSVALAGTFNNWNSNKNYFQETSKGIWEITLEIPTGRHLYKFVVNDTDWILDPLNTSISEDNQNNSSITVLDNGGKFIRTNDISKENPSYVYKKYTAIESPEWLKKAIIYQLHLRPFSKNGFRGLIDKIDYLKKLGINTIWLMPFQDVGIDKRIGEYGDPYAIKNFYSIDSSFGTKQELKKMINSLHESGFKIIMDWTLNRSSIDNALTTEHPDFFTHKDNGEIYYEVPNREYFAGFNFSNYQMRNYTITALKHWITEFDFDGFRFDDSDLAPHDFLNEIRQSLDAVKKEIVLISQSYDEYHHINSCNLTYDGSLQILIKQIGEGQKDQNYLAETYNSYKYSFPKEALRMRWIEEKEQIRAFNHFNENLIYPATSLLLLFDGIPHIMMGQEFNEQNYTNWTSLFDTCYLNWEKFDSEMFEHFSKLISIRKNNSAFWKGDLEFIENNEKQVISFIRKYENERFLVLVNLSDKGYTDLTFKNLNIQNATLLFGNTGTPIQNLKPFETKIYSF